MIEPWHEGLIATTLRYPHEIRDAKDYFGDIPDIALEPEMLKLAEQILQSKAADFDPSQFVDRYEEAVIELLKKEQAGVPVSREKAPSRPQNTIDLMGAQRGKRLSAWESRSTQGLDVSAEVCRTIFFQWPLRFSQCFVCLRSMLGDIPRRIPCSPGGNHRRRASEKMHEKTVIEIGGPRDSRKVHCTLGRCTYSGGLRTSDSFLSIACCRSAISRHREAMSR
jgi:hypothetical protein